MMTRSMLSLAVLAAIASVATAAAAAKVAPPSFDSLPFEASSTQDGLGGMYVFTYRTQDSHQGVASPMVNGGRRLKFDGNVSDGLLITSRGNAAIIEYAANDCFEECQRARLPFPEKYQGHYWGLGPVRSTGERDHIVAAINVIWRTNGIGKDFFPTTFGAPSLPNPARSAIWIGNYGMAGAATNQTLPFWNTDLSGGIGFWPTGWIPSPDPQLPFYWDAPEGTSTKYQAADLPSTNNARWYKYQPFDGPNYAPFFDWKATFPQALAYTPTHSNTQKYPHLCTKMTMNTSNGAPIGQWENAPCSQNGGEAAVGRACFCRAVCSSAESQACHAQRVCSADGTTIEVNYQYDHIKCECVKVAPERCCTECEEKLTGGRIVPTECRRMHPGDPHYHNEEADPGPTVLPGWRSVKACRRILWGNPRMPIQLGGVLNTNVDDNIVPTIRRAAEF